MAEKEEEENTQRSWTVPARDKNTINRHEVGRN
jgi:hypothetical protein